MATTHYGLTWWQWVVVGLLTIPRSLRIGTTPAEIAGAMFGAGIAAYIIVRLVAMASRSIRSRIRRGETAQS